MCTIGSATSDLSRGPPKAPEAAPFRGTERFVAPRRAREGAPGALAAGFQP